VALLKRIAYELRCAMLLTGAASIDELQAVPRVYTGELRSWLAAYRWLDLVENKP
jgi:isopentenyl diphosphate isomerase/L-lactate dehydrogenase-like FMN-dependent dehydrogenase